MTAPRYSIRPGRAEDVPGLPAIERTAGLLFKTYPDLGIPEELYDQATSVETLAAAQKAGRLWIAADARGEVVGFALVDVIDGYAHLEELDVLPSVGRQGIGSALINAVCQWAAGAGYPGVTLRTFRDVAWNRPFYERMGFRIVGDDSLPTGLRELENQERREGLPTDGRVTMLWRFGL